MKNPIPRQFRKDAKRIVEALKSLDKVIVSAHVNPDGDAVASLVAAGHVLRALGKEFVLYSSTGLPNYLDFVKLPGIVRTSLSPLPFAPQAGFFLDCNRADRMGKEDIVALAHSLPSVNVDHHEGYHGLGSVASWIVPEAAATAQLMCYVAMAAGLPLEGDLGNGLMVGLITDTGGFRHANTSVEVLELVTLLVRNGVDLSDIRTRIENCWSVGRFRLWADLFGRMQLHCDDQLAVCAVRLADLRKHCALKEDLEGFVEYMRRLKGVKITLMLREDAPGYWKISMRSSGNMDMEQVAARFGGGGHKNAAGGNIAMPEQEAIEAMVSAIQPLLITG